MHSYMLILSLRVALMTLGRAYQVTAFPAAKQLFSRQDFSDSDSTASNAVTGDGGRAAGGSIDGDDDSSDDRLKSLIDIFSRTTP